MTKLEEKKASISIKCFFQTYILFYQKEYFFFFKPPLSPATLSVHPHPTLSVPPPPPPPTPHIWSRHLDCPQTKKTSFSEVERPAPFLQRPQVWPLRQSMHCQDSRQQCTRGSPSVILVATLTLLDLVGGALCFLVDSHHSLGTAGLGQPVNSPRSYNIQSHGQGKHWVICSNYNIQSHGQGKHWVICSNHNIQSHGQGKHWVICSNHNIQSHGQGKHWVICSNHNIHSHGQGKHWVICSNYNIQSKGTLGHLLQLQQSMAKGNIGSSAPTRHTQSQPRETLGHLLQYDIHSHGQGKHWVIWSNYNRVTAKGNAGSSAQTTTLYTVTAKGNIGSSDPTTTESQPREMLGHLLQIWHRVTAKGNIGSSDPTTTESWPRETLGHLLQHQVWM